MQRGRHTPPASVLVTTGYALHRTVWGVSKPEAFGSWLLLLLARLVTAHTTTHCAKPEGAVGTLQ
jgi:hypothetical protein